MCFVVTNNRSINANVQLSRVELIDQSGQYFAYPSNMLITWNCTGYPQHENPSNLFDHSVYTKMNTARVLPVMISCEIPSGSEFDLDVYNRWQWYTANDSTDRDPISFELRFSHDGQTWKTVDQQINYNTTNSRYTCAYTGNLNF